MSESISVGHLNLGDFTNPQKDTLRRILKQMYSDLGGGGGSVTCVNGQTGVVVLNAGNVGAATTAQGALANTAVQPAAIEDMVESEDISTIVALTQTEYDAIPAPDAATFYIITGP